MEIRTMTEDEVTDLFDDMLDECYPVIEIGNTALLPSAVLKRTDPIAYREGLLDYADGELIEIV